MLILYSILCLLMLSFGLFLGWLEWKERQYWKNKRKIKKQNKKKD